MASSFKKKGARAKNVLPTGTRPSVKNGQLLISTGIVSLDSLLGGGLAVGSVALVDEDEHRAYSDTLLKYFLSEGAASDHAIAVASADQDPARLVKSLYTVVTKDKPSAGKPKASGAKSDASMEIAWRYNNSPKIESEVGGQSQRHKHAPSARGFGAGDFAHWFDVSKVLPEEKLQALKCTTVDLRADFDDDGVDEAEKNLPLYEELYQQVAAAAAPFAVNAARRGTERRSILRIVVQSMGSPYWTSTSPRWLSLIRFMQRIRSLLRNSYAVCLISVPGALLPGPVLRRAEWLSDTVLGLSSFAGTSHEKNPALREYHGFF